MALIRAIFKLSGSTPLFRDFENNTDKELATHIDASLRKRAGIFPERLFFSLAIDLTISFESEIFWNFLASKSNKHWRLVL